MGGVNMKKKYKCPLCLEEHEIDEYGWIQSCIGYFELGSMIGEIEKWLGERITKSTVKG